MMLPWMVAANLFAACTGAAAHGLALAAPRLRGRTRLPWLAALIAVAFWPVSWGLGAHTREAPVGTAVPIDPIKVIPSTIATLVPWPKLDVALTIAWATVSGALILRLLVTLVRLDRLRAAAPTAHVDDAEVRLSDGLGPAAVGLRQPEVVLPRSALVLDPVLRRLVLRHELEHARARDPLLLVTASILCALVPWNLPIWWIASRFRLAIEVDCDARVLGGGADIVRYSQLLLLHAQRRTEIGPAVTLAAPIHLERRLAAMNAFSESTRPLLRIAGGVLVAGAVLGACSASDAGRQAGAPTQAADVSTAQPDHPAAPAMVEFKVDGEARMLPDQSVLRYPDALRAANVEGEVLARFVVDTNGLVAPGTFSILRSDHPLFSDAVASAVRTMRFAPAEVGGHKVRQLVDQPFTFALQRSTPN